MRRLYWGIIGGVLGTSAGTATFLWLNEAASKAESFRGFRSPVRG